MKHYGLGIPEGSEIINLTVPTGTIFPSAANSGEMFFRTDENKLYIHNGTSWVSPAANNDAGSLDGLDSLQFLRSDITDYLSANSYIGAENSGAETTRIVGMDSTANIIYVGGIDNLTTDPELRFRTTGIDRVTIDVSGNIGINTPSPTQKLDINDDTVRVRTAKTPASATDTGAVGQIAWDVNYVYVCTATNTWKRSAITTW